MGGKSAKNHWPAVVGRSYFEGPRYPGSVPERVSKIQAATQREIFQAYENDCPAV